MYTLFMHFTKKILENFLALRKTQNQNSSIYIFFSLSTFQTAKLKCPKMLFFFAKNKHEIKVIAKLSCSKVREIWNKKDKEFKPSMLMSERDFPLSSAPFPSSTRRRRRLTLVSSTAESWSLKQILGKITNQLFKI